MGNQIARDIAAAPLGLEAKLGWHLSGNHYPPIHESFIPVAVKAIRLADVGLWDDEIAYPNGLTRTVRFTVDELHLEPFLQE
jgi:hypothetical protein